MLYFWFVRIRLVYPMLPVSLGCPFLIAPSLLSNVYSCCSIFNLCVWCFVTHWLSTYYYLVDIVWSVPLRFTLSDNPFGMFKLFWKFHLPSDSSKWEENVLFSTPRGTPTPTTTSSGCVFDDLSDLLALGTRSKFVLCV